MMLTGGLLFSATTDVDIRYSQVHGTPSGRPERENEKNQKPGFLKGEHYEPSHPTKGTAQH